MSKTKFLEGQTIKKETNTKMCIQTNILESFGYKIIDPFVFNNDFIINQCKLMSKEIHALLTRFPTKCSECEVGCPVPMFVLYEPWTTFSIAFSCWQYI